MLSLFFRGDLVGAAWAIEEHDNNEQSTVCALQEDITKTIENVKELIDKSTGSIIGTIRTPPEIIEYIQRTKREFLVRPQHDFSASMYVPDSARLPHNQNTQCAMNVIMKQYSNSDLPTIKLLTIQSHLHISQSALKELNMIDFEDHPNPHFGKSLTKHCLVSLMDEAKSRGGKAMLKRMICIPSSDAAVIANRQQEILQLISESQLEQIQQPLQRSKNVCYVLNKLSTENCSDDLRSLVKFVTSAVELVNIVAKSNSLIFQKIKQYDNEIKQLEQLSSTINRVVDFERGKLEQRVVIKYGIDANLDSLRLLYSQLPERLSKVAEDIAATIKAVNSTVKAINVVYFPQLGYLTAAPIIHQFELLGLFEEWQVVFTTDKIAYFKNSWMRRLDEELGDVHAEIVDSEIEIYEEIRERVLEQRTVIEDLHRIMTEIDCMIGLSMSCIKLNLSPCASGEGRFNLVNSRHVISQHCNPEPFIPNHFQTSKPITIITGPNSSGKSILMKQIGLTVSMNQTTGLAACEPESQLPILKQIFTRIKSAESMGTLQSSFAIELEQLKRALEGCSRESILLIDEFGKGTLTEDGISLLAALIEYIAELEHPPWTIIVTHFREVFDHLSETVKDSINWLQMEVCSKAIGEQDEPVFLFKAVSGISAKSLGIHCAKSAKIPDSVIKEAQEISVKLGAGIAPRDLAWTEISEEQENAMISLIKDMLAPFGDE